MGLFALLSETFLIARQALAANRMRSLLALLGIVIGVATVIGMGSLINGFERSFEKGIQSFSNGTIYVRPFRPGVRFNGGIPDSLRKRRAFSPEDARAIMEQAPAVGAVGVVKLAYDDIRLSRGGHQTRSTQTFGSDEGLLRTRGFDLAEGRFFTPQEVARRANVVVVGHDTREALFQDGSGIGKSVHLNGIPFTVIGEFEVKGKFLGQNLDEMVCLPWSTVDKYWATPPNAPPWFAKKGQVFMDAVPVTPEQTEQAIQQMRSVLRARRHLPVNKTDDFEIFSDDVFLSLYHTITGGIVALMMLISSIALLVGGIGVMNIMLVAVTERTREIGVRKALGAPRRAILLQFLIEAVLLTMTGGAVGILLGGGIATLVRTVSGLPTYVSMGSVIAAVVVSTFVGVFCGLYPAVRASRLDPVESLRYE
ncbi:MAG: ABC transporter permease [Candidatus Eisenbacteria bacterium]|nr:ABC transporter permease [Candidatus Eisenbacteria bacterium]